MSKHWKPDEDILRAVRRTHRLPPGATIALMLLAAACVGAAIGLYEVAGPRVVFEDGAELGSDGVGR
jgi:hypothetical protein